MAFSDVSIEDFHRWHIFENYPDAQPLWRGLDVNKSLNNVECTFLLEFQVLKPHKSQEEHVEAAKLQ